MKNVKDIKDRAAEFSEPGCGFIHSEMRDGDHVETVLNGEMTAIMSPICAIIDRLANISNSEFKELACLIMGMPDHGGYSVISQAVDEPEWLTAMAQRMDAVQALTTEPEKEPEPDVISVKDYERDVAMLRSKLTEAELRLETQNEVHKAQLKAKDANIKALNKDILRLEHELIDLEKRQQFLRGAER